MIDKTFKKNLLFKTKKISHRDPKCDFQTTPIMRNFCKYVLFITLLYYKDHNNKIATNNTTLFYITNRQSQTSNTG